MTRLSSSSKATAVNWLERRKGSVVDFRLPSDGHDIPSSVLAQRIAEFMTQENARILAELNGQAPTRQAAAARAAQAEQRAAARRPRAPDEPVSKNLSMF